MHPDIEIVCTEIHKKVYLQDKTAQTTSIANPLVQTTPLGIRFTAPLHGILPKNAQYTSKYKAMPKVPASLPLPLSQSPWACRLIKTLPIYASYLPP